MDMEVSSEGCGGEDGSVSLSRGRRSPCSASQLSNGTGDAPSGGPRTAVLAAEAAEDEGCSGGKLKRSCSAPMINQLLPQARVSAPPTPTPPRWVTAPAHATQVHLCSPDSYTTKVDLCSPYSHTAKVGVMPVGQTLFKITEINVCFGVINHSHCCMDMLSFTDILGFN